MSGVLGEFGFYYGGIDPAEFGVEVTPSGSQPLGRVYVTIGGERVDQVAQMAYGRQNGAVEALLIVNPGLADKGYNLVAGVAIFLPELTVARAQATSREVALWG